MKASSAEYSDWGYMLEAECCASHERSAVLSLTAPFVLQEICLGQNISTFHGPSVHAQA